MNSNLSTPLLKFIPTNSNFICKCGFFFLSKSEFMSYRFILWLFSKNIYLSLLLENRPWWWLEGRFLKIRIRCRKVISRETKWQGSLSEIKPDNRRFLLRKGDMWILGGRDWKTHSSYFWRAFQPLHLLTVLCYHIWESANKQTN
jgi:hypothetical protein